jgi:hypothetical protein
MYENLEKLPALRYLYDLGGCVTVKITSTQRSGRSAFCSATKEALEHGWDPPLGFEDSSWDKLVLFDPDVETEDFFKLSSKGTSHEQSLGNGASRAQSR